LPSRPCHRIPAIASLPSRPCHPVPAISSPPLTRRDSSFALVSPGVPEQAAEKRGLRAWFRPGRVWIGTIVIPGGDSKTRYVFQVVEWNTTAKCWIVSHAAHGDEQLCHLTTSDDDDGEGLRISFSDAETTCEGAVDVDGIIRGRVAQLLRPEEEYKHSSSEKDVFVLEPAVGACFTPMVEARVVRLARWKIAPKVMGGLFAALEAVQGLEPDRVLIGPLRARARPRELCDALRKHSRLVSVECVSREDLERLASRPNECPSSPNSGEGGTSRSASFGAFDPYDDDDVETVENGASCDARVEVDLHDDESMETQGRFLGKPYASTVGTGFLDATFVSKSERDWWRLWRTVSFAAEFECCAVRERARRLKQETFATREVKRSRTREERSVGGRRAAHVRGGELLRRQHVLLWRALNASGMPHDVLNEVVAAQARALRQSEFRLRVAYHSFDESLRGFENRIPEESITRRSSVVPEAGFAEKMGDCSICACSFDPGEDACVLDCQHPFHPECIRGWVHNNPSCPNCREEVRERLSGDPEDLPDADADADEAEAEARRPAGSETDRDAAADEREVRAGFGGVNPFVPMSVFDHIMSALSGDSIGLPRFPVPPPGEPFWGDEWEEEESESDGDFEEEDADARASGRNYPRAVETDANDEDAMPELVESSDADSEFDDYGGNSDSYEMRVPDLVGSSDDDAETMNVD